MRTRLFNRHRFKAAIAAIVAVIMLCFVLPCEAFAAGENPELAERHAWFTYGYTECTGEIHAASESGIQSSGSSGTEYPVVYSTSMMLCDTDHVLHVEGDGVTSDNAAITALDPDVLDIDSEGNVTLHGPGTARVRARVAADQTYDECIIYLYVKVDRHEGWIEDPPHFADRPEEWGLEINTAEGPHQLGLHLRPGAGVKYSSDNPQVAIVDQNGFVSPLSAGVTQIFMEIDDGGGRYKACRIGWTVKVSGDTLPEDLYDPEGGSEDRHVWFEYEYTECTGAECLVSNLNRLNSEDIDSMNPAYYSTTMMLCDTGYVLHVKGEDVTDENVTIVSMDPNVLDIGTEGHVTLHKTGTARIKATVAADEKYKKSILYLEVTVDRHEGWNEISGIYYASRPGVSSLDLCKDDKPQQLVLDLRPGASAKYYSGDESLVTVGNNGLVTPLSAGTTQIIIEVDDGGGKYKPCRISRTINITGDPIPGVEARPALRLEYRCATCNNTAYLSSYLLFPPYGESEYLEMDMKRCDTKHNIRLVGMGVTADNVTFRSADPDILDVDSKGNVTLKKTGVTVITVTVAAYDIYKEDTVYLLVYSGWDPQWIGEDGRIIQRIAGKQGPFDVDWQKGLRLDLQAWTGLEYSVCAGENIATVDPNGCVTFTGKGRASIKVSASGNDEFLPAETIINITAHDYAEEKAAALRAEIAKARSLKKPVLNVKALKGRKNKLTWGKVANADGYIVYVRYPGKKKYVKAAVRKATVKSVKHKGLSKGKVYRYKVRAYKKVNGKIYYSPFSRVRKTRVR